MRSDYYFTIAEMLEINQPESIVIIVEVCREINNNWMVVSTINDELGQVISEQ